MRAVWSLRFQLRGRLGVVELVAIRARRRNAAPMVLIHTYWGGGGGQDKFSRDPIKSGRGTSKGSYFSFSSSVQSEG